jgi:hypothetical protein
MWSPVKTVGVGALVFAFSSVFLVATSSGPQRAGVPSMVADGERAAPVEVIGELVRTCGAGPQGDPTSYEIIEGVERMGGWMCAGLTFRWSDARLDGRIEDTGNSALHLDRPQECHRGQGPCAGIMVHSRTISIENGDGAWRMRAPLVFISTDYPADRDAPGWLTPFGATWVLYGEGLL